MFTGIVTRTCPLVSWTPGAGCRHLALRALPSAASDDPLEPWSDLVLGESIAVSGVCLTLVRATPDELGFEVVEETWRSTALGECGPGSEMNLERSLRVGDRFGGHYVTGHVDATGRIVGLQEGGDETILRIEADPGVPFRTLEKGSITVDGISLTVVESVGSTFSAALIPHTMAMTNLRDRRVGDRVNLEMDLFGKWVEALLVEREGERRQ